MAVGEIPGSLSLAVSIRIGCPDSFANPCGDAWHEGNFLFLLFVDHVVSTHFLRLYVMLFDVLLKKQGKIAIGPPLYLQLQIWSPYNLIHKFGPPVL